VIASELVFFICQQMWFPIVKCHALCYPFFVWSCNWSVRAAYCTLNHVDVLPNCQSHHCYCQLFADGLSGTLKIQMFLIPNSWEYSFMLLTCYVLEFSVSSHFKRLNWLSLLARDSILALIYMKLSMLSAFREHVWSKPSKNGNLENWIFGS
jgi:hypothetical protein